MIGAKPCVVWIDIEDEQKLTTANKGERINIFLLLTRKKSRIDPDQKGRIKLSLFVFCIQNPYIYTQIGITSKLAQQDLRPKSNVGPVVRVNNSN